MVVTSANIPSVSEYTVSDSGPFTTAIFNALFTDAKAILDQDDPGLTSELYDRCHALMICHLFETRKSEMGFSSWSSGDFRGSHAPGETTFLVQYRSIISRVAASSIPYEQADVARSDIDVGDMALDMNTPEEFFTS